MFWARERTALTFINRCVPSPNMFLLSHADENTVSARAKLMTQQKATEGPDLYSSGVPRPTNQRSRG